MRETPRVSKTHLDALERTATSFVGAIARKVRIFSYISSGNGHAPSGRVRTKSLRIRVCMCAARKTFPPARAARSSRQGVGYPGLFTIPAVFVARLRLYAASFRERTARAEREDTAGAPYITERAMSSRPRNFPSCTSRRYGSPASGQPRDFAHDARTRRALPSIFHRDPRARARAHTYSYFRAPES